MLYSNKFVQFGCFEISCTLLAIAEQPSLVWLLRAILPGSMPHELLLMCVSKLITLQAHFDIYLAQSKKIHSLLKEKIYAT